MVICNHRPKMPSFMHPLILKLQSNPIQIQVIRSEGKQPKIWTVSLWEIIIINDHHMQFFKA